MNGWRVEHQCPQCGAPVVLEEDSRLLACPYCRVRHLLAGRDNFHYYLPSRDEAAAASFYLPYWRVRGLYFSCHANGVKPRLLDSSAPALDLAGLPPSLGVRPQAVPLRFLSSPVPATCLPRERPLSRAIEELVARLPAGSRGMYAAFIGEVASLVYLPVSCQLEEVADGLDGQPLPGVDRDILEARRAAGEVSRTRWQLQFIPAPCPACGWDLEGEAASLVFTCSNCDRAWSAAGGKLRQLTVYGPELPAAAGPWLRIPFWCLQVELAELDLESVADLVRLANLPRAVTPELQGRQLLFWLPAFKVQPRLYLRLARMLTVDQPECPSTPAGGQGLFYPVNLPAAEALQGIKVLLAELLKPRRQWLPLLARLQVTARSSRLVYRPFLARGREVVDAELGLALNRNALKWGRLL